MEARMVEIIRAVLQPEDNAVRKQAEQALAALFEEHPDDLVRVCCELIKDSRDQKVRMFCSTELRKKLSEFGDKDKKNWQKLSPGTRALVQLGLFDVLSREEDKVMRHNLCDLVG
jgi:hypothetical protein